MLGTHSSGCAAPTHAHTIAGPGRTRDTALSSVSALADLGLGKVPLPAKHSLAPSGKGGVHQRASYYSSAYQPPETNPKSGASKASAASAAREGSWTAEQVFYWTSLWLSLLLTLWWACTMHDVMPMALWCAAGLTAVPAMRGHS